MHIRLIISVIVYALGGGLLEVIVSPIIEALPNKNKEGSMSLLHSFYCWGQMSVVFISTFIIWIIGTDMWFILPLLWSLFPLYNMFKFLHVPILPLVEDGKGMNIKELFSSPSFYLLLYDLCGASELTMSQWSPSLLRRVLAYLSFLVIFWAPVYLHYIWLSEDFCMVYGVIVYQLKRPS